MKLPSIPSRNSAILLVEQGPAAPRFLVADYDQKKLKLLLNGQLVRDESVTLAQQLRGRLEAESIRCAQAALLVSRPTVEFFAGSMPPAGDDELPALVENFVAQETDDTDDRIIDFLVLGGEAETATDVLALTCDRQVVTESVRQFKEAGFRLRAVTYRGLGSVQLIHQVAHQKLPTTIAIVSTDSSTEIAVLRQRQPVLFRTLQRGFSRDDAYASALAAEVQRTLAFIGAGDEDSAQIYLIGSKDQLSETAEVLSETVSSSVTITGVLDRVDDSAVAPFDDAANYAQLIGIASALHQERLPANFLMPRKAAQPARPWQRYATVASLVCVVLGVVGYHALTGRAQQLEQIEQRRAKIAELSPRVNRAAELQAIVDSVDLWGQTDITWLDELKELSDRFPERSQALVKKMSMSAVAAGVGEFALSVQVNSPEVITELETAIRDERHAVHSDRVTEVNDSDELTWSFETRITFQALPKPEDALPELVAEVNPKHPNATKPPVPAAELPGDSALGDDHSEAAP